MLTFDIDRFFVAGWTKSPVKGGYLRAFFNFSTSTPVPLTVIAVLISDQTLSLHQGGKVIIEST